MRKHDDGCEAEADHAHDCATATELARLRALAEAVRDELGCSGTEDSGPCDPEDLLALRRPAGAGAGAVIDIGPRHEVMAKLGCLTWADARAIVAALDFAYGDDDGTTSWGALRATEPERRRGKCLWRELTSARRRARR